MKGNTTAAFPHDPLLTCSGCGSLIFDRYVLRSMECFWHEDCLKCASCGCRLAELGSTLFTKNNLTLCRRDYLKLFGPNGHCSVCHKIIPAFELVMRARSKVFHLECFACQECGHRFCVGDRYYFSDERILCEYDFEEKMLFKRLTLTRFRPSPFTSPPFSSPPFSFPPFHTSTAPTHLPPPSLPRLSNDCCSAFSRRPDLPVSLGSSFPLCDHLHTSSFQGGLPKHTVEPL